MNWFMEHPDAILYLLMFGQLLIIAIMSGRRDNEKHQEHKKKIIKRDTTNTKLSYLEPSKSGTNLSSSEKAFLREQNISEDDVFDARNYSIARAKELMTGRFNFMIGPPCKKAGHRLKTSRRHCIQCDTSRIAYKKRYRAPASVYVAHSKKGMIVKVGSAIDTDRRLIVLNNQSYGGYSDWRDVFHMEHAEAGRVETEVHKKLSQFQVYNRYFKEGEEQIANELFKCDPSVAIEAVKRTK